MRYRLLIAVVLGMAGGAAGQIVKKSDSPRFPEADFLYDAPDQTVSAKLLSSDRGAMYDGGIAELGGAVWLTWLEYQADAGDRVFVGRLEGDGILSRIEITNRPGVYANPRITAVSPDRAWVTYEAEVAGDWELFLARPDDKGNYASPVRLTQALGPDIDHNTASDGSGGLCIVWQNGGQGVFQIEAMHVGNDGPGRPLRVSPTKTSQWHPSVAVTPTGEVFVVWDEFRSGNYDVMLSRHQGGKWIAPQAVADSPAFEGRAQVACDAAGRAWILWEEDAINWGRPYQGKLKTDSLPISDACGPLHRFRQLHIAVHDGRTLCEVNPPLAMPAFGAVMSRPDAPDGVARLGVYYERGQLTIDRTGRVWVVYRHFYAPWLGTRRWTHVEGGYGIYARHLSEAGWSKLYSFDAFQRDGMQRLDVAPHGDGIAAVWTTGRTDRRGPKDPCGMQIAALAPSGGSAPGPNLLKAVEPKAHPTSRPAETTRHVIEQNGTRYELYFGDLHRHTDLSLCFVPLDGTMDDAYRYAVDPGGLDFLGVTDHARDIDKGLPGNLLWWRCRKEVNRHHLPGRFFPLFTYEASREDTADENVISLRPNTLRPDTVPIPGLWKQLDNDSFTIPHQPIRRRTWDYHDEQRRPLAEIYQGFRNNVIQPELMAGLQMGYKFGLICSSDHLSTGASYAAVYSSRQDRESVFRSLQARRTYGATARIILDIRAGDHFMGESFVANSAPTFSLFVRGTAPIKTITLYRGQTSYKSWTGRGTEMTLQFTDPEHFQNSQYYLFHVKQTDGHQAWSSPIWVSPPKT
jgi:hypothetical protein